MRPALTLLALASSPRANLAVPWHARELRGFRNSELGGGITAALRAEAYARSAQGRFMGHVGEMPVVAMTAGLRADETSHTKR